MGCQGTFVVFGAFWKKYVCGGGLKGLGRAGNQKQVLARFGDPIKMLPRDKVRLMIICILYYLVGYNLEWTLVTLEKLKRNFDYSRLIYQ